MVSQFLIEFILIFGMKSTQRVTNMYSPCMLHTCQYMYLPYSLLTELKTEKKTITFRPFNHFPTILLLFPMTKNHVKFDFVLQEKKIHNNDNKKKPSQKN